MLASLEGLDHLVVMVRHLDPAADQWRALGFTLSPRGTHSAHLGSGNYTVMFGVDYVELLGILHDTPLNAASRAFLDRRGEGIERAAFTTSDAAAGVQALRARGMDVQDPVAFSRPVDLPGGGRAEAAFKVFHWPVEQRPADLRIFACQHLTRDVVWLPELQAHPNSATGIVCTEIVTPQPAEAAAQLARLIDGSAQSCEAGVRVATAPGRGDFLFLTHDAFVARRPSARREALPAEGAVALVLRVTDLARAARSAGAAAVVDTTSVTVPADRANGTMIVFEA
ncbi:VOC family protein [Pseudorhodoferax sp. LjRoot39]|uniref:VOC family protein n=1 Tax=Pseudorhodoferax sp. LjRoot39 TaxID=3342328 RepID=UPI003ECC6211